MKQVFSILAVAAVIGLGIGSTFAADPMKEKEAKPTLKERFTKDTVKGTLSKISGEHYTIQDNDGQQVTIHVDKSTKLDKVVEGDKVKAYITDTGHTTTLQRDK